MPDTSVNTNSNDSNAANSNAAVTHAPKPVTLDHKPADANAADANAADANAADANAADANAADANAANAADANAANAAANDSQHGGKRRTRRSRHQRGRKSRRAGNVWTDLVKRVFNENKHKSGYKFKHALMDAKKLYKGAVVEPNRVGPTAAKTVATSIAKKVGKIADRALGTRRQRGGKSRRNRH